MAENLHQQLDRWVVGGLLTAEQAARIEKAEYRRPAGPAAPGTPGGPRSAYVVEALGYLGGLLAVIAGFVAVGQLWPGISDGTKVIFAVLAAAVLLVAGAAVRPEREPAFGRLRSVLWALSVGALAAGTGLLTADIWEFEPPSVILATAIVSTAYALALWLRHQAPLQHLVMFASVAVTAGAAVVRVDPDVPTWLVGVAVWVTAVLWGLAVYRGYLPPRLAGLAAAAIGTVVGAQLTMEVAAGHVLALVTVVGLLAAGVLLRNIWVLGIGAFAVIQIVPQTATRYLPDTLGAPVALLAVGVVLLVIALRLARSGRTPRTR